MDSGADQTNLTGADMNRIESVIETVMKIHRHVEGIAPDHESEGVSMRTSHSGRVKRINHATRMNFRPFPHETSQKSGTKQSEPSECISHQAALPPNDSTDSVPDSVVDLTSTISSLVDFMQSYPEKCRFPDQYLVQSPVFACPTLFGSFCGLYPFP